MDDIGLFETFRSNPASVAGASHASILDMQTLDSHGEPEATTLPFSRHGSETSEESEASDSFEGSGCSWDTRDCKSNGDFEDTEDGGCDHFTTCGPRFTPKDFDHELALVDESATPRPVYHKASGVRRVRNLSPTTMQTSELGALAAIADK